jgi:hypothetical protein
MQFISCGFIYFSFLIYTLRLLNLVGSKFLTKTVVEKYLTEVKGLKGLKKLTKLVQANDEVKASKLCYVIARCLQFARTGM